MSEYSIAAADSIGGESRIGRCPFSQSHKVEMAQGSGCGEKDDSTDSSIFEQLLIPVKQNSGRWNQWQKEEGGDSKYLEKRGKKLCKWLSVTCIFQLKYF